MRQIEKYDKYENEIKRIMSTYLDEVFFDTLIDLLAKCESPIERIFYTQFICVKSWLDLRSINTRIKIFPQKIIKTSGNEYRVDFYIEKPKSDGETIKLIIECDGHEFHERTKEQAMRDKKRDRELIKCGYKVIHFTGSEIYKDAFYCVNEVLTVLGCRKEG
jgi:very-short-patch-repair endonuclease